MGYRITYGKTAVKEELKIKNYKFYKLLIICSVALILVISIGWIGWSNQTIRHWMLPGDAEVTEMALQDLVVDIKKGESLSDAVTAFCHEIISNAKIN